MKKILIILCVLSLCGCAVMAVRLLMPSPSIKTPSKEETCLKYFQFQKDGKGFNHWKLKRDRDYWDRTRAKYKNDKKD
jgi:hypothetical protein